jgi:hypothetical protein
MRLIAAGPMVCPKSKNPASEAVRRERQEEWRRPAHGHQMHELSSIDAMRLDQTLGQSRHVACASGCMSMGTSLEEGIKLHRFAGIFPEQFLTVAGRHREAVVAADQRMVIRCFSDDLSGFVHDVSHVPPPKYYAVRFRYSLAKALTMRSETDRKPVDE